MDSTHFTVSVFIVLMLISAAVAIATKWIRIPYTLALVVVGLLISPMEFLPAVHISPELILLIFLPALLFEASWNLNIDHLRKDLGPILALAVPGVCIATGAVGTLLHYGIGMAWIPALLFGTMISATDPVSVLALFKHFGLPKRLSVLIEGESLLNDGTAVVLFRIILALMVGTAAGAGDSIVWSSLREFGVVVFGGLAVGVVVGLLCSAVTARINDHLLEITLTTIAAYGSFLLAESLQVSPVIAVLIAGLVVGNYGRRIGMSPTTEMAVTSFWEYAAFVANSLVFLLVGLEVRVSALAQNSGRIGWAIAAMLISRVVAVYGTMGVMNFLGGKVPFRWQHVQVWGGLRGSLSIALVLSLPAASEFRPQLVAMTFGTVIFSLLAQGLTLKRLLGLLKFGQTSPENLAYEMVRGEMISSAAEAEELDALLTRGMVSGSVHKQLRERVAAQEGELQERLARLNQVSRGPEQEQLLRVRRHLTDVRKARLSQSLREGLISESTYRSLVEKLDEETVDQSP